MDRPHVIVLAQDLIWQTRLVNQVTGAGGAALAARDVGQLAAAASGAQAAIVDLTAMAYDPIEAIEDAAAAGLRVLAVGPHEDHPLRKRALGAGAQRVLAYRKLHEDGPATIAAWLAALRLPV